MSDAVLADLSERLGAELAAEIRRREQQSQTPMTERDERQWSQAWMLGELRLASEDALRSGRVPLSPDEEQAVIVAALNRIFGAGTLEQFLNDPTVQDIHINGADIVWVKRRDGRRERVQPVAASDDELRQMVAELARRHSRIEQRFDFASPRLNMQLPNGDRMHAIWAVATRPSVTIRRHDFDINDLSQMVDLGVMTPTVGAFLAAAVKAERNLVVSGGTGTGKTTLLRCLINEVPANERLITVEDNLELGIAQFRERHPNVVEMESRNANLEGEGAISLAQLVVESLRMDPDRVIVGECRGAETVPMLLAMSQGNDGSMTTIHAESSKAVFGRIQTYCATLAEERIEPQHTNLLIRSAVHFVVHLGWAGGRRAVESIREVDPMPGEILASTEVFRPGQDGMAQPGFGISSEEHREKLAAAGFDPRLASGNV